MLLIVHGMIINLRNFYCFRINCLISVIFHIKIVICKEFMETLKIDEFYFFPCDEIHLTVILIKI